MILLIIIPMIYVILHDSERERQKQNIEESD